MREDQSVEGRGGGERAAAEARASIQRAREIVASSRALLLGEAPPSGESLVIMADDRAGAEARPHVVTPQSPQAEAG